MGKPAWSEALRAASDGVTLDLEVVPNADRSEFPTGYDPWRKRLKARLAAPATEGRANEELIRVVAAFFQIPTGTVQLLSGATSRQKRVALRSVTHDEALGRIREALDES